MDVDVIVADVVVEPADDGALLVRWELDGGDTAVDVAVGPTPEAVDHDHQLTVEAGHRELRLTDLAPGRHYVSVAPHGGGGAVVAAERRIPFEGVANFRDLGGYRTRDGSRTRWGLVFRADGLHRFTPADLDLYHRLGLRLVYDLRHDEERNTDPDPVESRHLALLGSRGPDDDLTLPTGLTAADGEAFLRETYGRMLANAGPLFGRLLRDLTDDAGLPALFHCTAGKDRTGMTAALLLELLGVDRDTVLDDYELSAGTRPRTLTEGTVQRLVGNGMSHEAIAGLLGAPRWAMAETLADLDETYGGIEAYLTGPAEMITADLETLRHRLLVR